MNGRGRKTAYLGKMFLSVYTIDENLTENSDYQRLSRWFERLFKKSIDYCAANNVGNTKTRYNLFMAYAFTTYLLLDYKDGTGNSLSEPRKYSQFINKCLCVTATKSKYYKYPISVDDMVFFLRHFQDNTPVLEILRDVFNFELTDNHKSGIAKIIKELKSNPQMPANQLKKIFNMLLDLLSESLD